jgi:isocitrate dehydrogenase
MLVHIAQADTAERVHNAWLCTIEDGIHTYDIFTESTSRKKVGTKEFADAVIARLGEKPEHLTPVEYDKEAQMNLAIRPAGKPPMKLRAGVDLFIDRRDGNPDQIAAIMQQFNVDGTRLTTISNRGTKVWPNGNPDTYWSDHWSCRFESNGELFTPDHVVKLLLAADRAGFDVIKTEGLYTFNGERGYSLAQGE